MLIAKPQVNIVTRVVELSTGQLVRAYFAVIMTQGVPEVRFLGYKAVDVAQEAPAAAGAPVAMPLLSGLCATCFGEVEAPAFRSASSPFYKPFDFLVSQLARAPSIA